VVIGALPQRARARFQGGRFASTDDGVAVFSLPNAIHRDRCEEVRAEVEAALSDHFGAPIRLRLVVDVGADAPAAPSSAEFASEEDEEVRAEELTDAPPLPSPEDRIKEAFPGAEEVDG
jgi:hypothetical protein